MEELTSSAAAKYLGVSRTRIYELSKAGRIGRQVAGAYWVYTKTELDAYRAQSINRKGGRPRSIPRDALSPAYTIPNELQLP